GDGGEDDLHGGHPPAAGQLGAQFQADEPVGAGGEAFGVALGGAQRLGQAHAGDGEALFDLGVEVGELGLAVGGDVAAHQGGAAAEDDRRRDDDEREDAEHRREGDHGDRGGYGGGQVGGDGRRGGGDHGLHAGDVAGQPGLDLAATGAGE